MRPIHVNMPAPRKVIIDIDGGLESCLGLALALRCAEIEVVAVTTVCGAVNGMIILHNY